jgi:hypothetical protein
MEPDEVIRSLYICIVPRTETGAQYEINHLKLSCMSDFPIVLKKYQRLNPHFATRCVKVKGNIGVPTMVYPYSGWCQSQFGVCVS